MRTGYAAFRLGILAYLVPFIFVYSHELIMIGSPWRIALAFVTAVAGAVLIGTGLIGYGAGAMNWPRRILAFLAGVALLLPPGGGIPHSTLLNIAGAAVGFPALFWDNIAGLQSRGSANRKKKVAEQASDFS